MAWADSPRKQALQLGDLSSSPKPTQFARRLDRSSFEGFEILRTLMQLHGERQHIDLA
jgi:hypothetical protein